MTVGAAFNGTTSEIRSNTGTDFTHDVYTFVAMVYNTSATSQRSIVNFANGANSNPRVVFDSTTSIAIEHDGGDFPFWGSVASSASWHLVVITKATGTVAPKLYLTKDGSTWTPDGAAADAGTAPNPPATISDVWIGDSLGASYWNGEIVAIALANTEANSSTVHGLTNFSNWSSLTNLRFFTGQTLLSAGTMNDTGSGNNDETSRTGISAGSQAIPSWFTNFGADTNVAVQSAAVTATANAPTITRTDPYAVSSTGATVNGSNLAFTFSGYTPLENDVIAIYVSSATVLGALANASLPSGWVNPLGDGVEINSDSHGMACFYHLVTSAEQTAVTVSWTITVLDAAETGYVQAVAVRNVDPANVIDGFNTAQDSANTVTPHVLAGITGSGVLLDNSLVVSSVAKDATGAYSSTPGGWTQLRADNTNNGRWLGYRSTNTVLNTDVTATNITPSAGDEYCSITLAFSQKPTGTSVTIPAAASVSATANNSSSAVAATIGSAAVTVAGNNVTVSRRVDVGVAAVTATANNSSAAVASTIGSAAVTVTGNNVTVTTGGDTNVTVGSAAVTATANNASHSIAVALTDTNGQAYVIAWAGDELGFTHTSSAVAHAVGNAPVTVTGNNVTVTTGGDTNVTVGSAAVTATANNAGVSVAHAVGNAAVTATGNNVTAAPSPSVGSAAVTVTANNSGAAVASTIGYAPVTVTGNNATVSTTTNVNVDVGSAAVTATANNAGISAAHAVGNAAVTSTANAVTAAPSPSAGNAAVTATANNSGVSGAHAVGNAAVTATGNDSGISNAHAVGVATVTVTANNATVSTSAQTNVAVGVATVTAVANDSGVSAAHAVGVAAVTVAGNQITAAPALTVGSAAVSATANNVGAAVAATVLYALVLVAANNLQPDNGAGVATLIGLIRASRPDLTRVSRPYPHRAQRPEV